MIEDLIAEGRFQDALDELVDIEDEQVRYLRLVCLFGLERFEEGYNESLRAKILAKDTYYDVLCYYIGFLKETERYQDAVDTLVEELSMPYIPFQYESRLNDFYDQILLEKKEYYAVEERKKTIFEEKELRMILTNGASDDLMMMAFEQLETCNIRRFLPEIRLFLKNEEQSSVFKTLLLLILREQEVDEMFELHKHEHQIECNPLYLEGIEDSYWFEEIATQLESCIADDNPSLYEMSLEFLNYFLHDWYPLFELLGQTNEVACAIHFHLASLMTLEIELDDLCYLYGTTPQDVTPQLKMIEKCQ